MNFKSLGLGLVLGVALFAFTSYLLGWLHLEKAPELDIPRGAAAETTKPKNEAEFASMRKHADDLQAQLADAQDKIQRLETEKARQAVLPPKTEETPAEANAKKEIAKLAAIFPDADFQAVLDKIDWDSAGDAAQKMLPLLADVISAVAEGKQIPESAGDIQKLNGELVSMALKLKNAGVPGTGINGSFSHPSVTSNLLYATLEKAGKNLSTDQRASLQMISKRFADEDAARRAGYGADTPELQKLLDEVRMKDSFYNEAGQLLNSDQRNFLYNDNTKGRTRADIWSTGVVWTQFAQPFPVTSRQDFEEKLLNQFNQGMKLDSAEQTRFNNIVKSWTERLSDNLFNSPADAYSQKGFMKTDQVRAAAESQLALLQRILAEVNLSKEQREALMKNPGVLVPLYMPKK